MDRTPLAGERVFFDITEDSAGIRADNICRAAPGRTHKREGHEG
ncbi:hypothetical protein QFZ43_005950 [Streptomyces afghaniensis]|nr:hypothetical protein [Streptomyces afghaniensis]